VIEPLTNLSPSPDQSSLLSAPTGVLFYGPPGTGKTTLARALAHESKACFMNIQISEISSKWHGESEKFVSAIFSLAKKVEPTLVFIDEIDSLLSTRRDQDQQFLHAIKAEFVTFRAKLLGSRLTSSRFMSKWDGLSSIDQAGKRARIVIIGATNRRDNIDPACLSRMPSQFLVPLPDHQQRESLLRIFLRGITIDDEQLDLNALALSMDSLSGRDIQNECREAALIPQREAKKEKKSAGMNDQEKSNLRGDVVRGLAMQDFIEAREMAGGQHKRQGHPSSQEFPSDGGRETTHR
jgi:SpoVK/Ycf46/Vps4 family AAA+-type ATPase